MKKSLISLTTCAVLALLGGFGWVSNQRVDAQTPQRATLVSQSRYAFTEESIVFEKSAGTDFKVLIMPDVQLEENDRTDGEWTKTFTMMEELITQTAPDLLITLGDLVWENASKQTIQDVADFLDGFAIPWAPIFGNHEGDTQMQALTGLNKQVIMDVFDNAEYCLFRDGPQSVSGNGNYFINLVDVATVDGERVEKLDYSFFLMDSHGYDVESGYDHLKKDQIAWYADNVEKLTLLSNKGKAESAWEIPKSMMFLHIALPEYVEAYDKWSANGKPASSGYGERIDLGSEARVNSGMFNQILYSGSTTDVFAGHQHKNAFGVLHKGVWLRYALKTGPCLADTSIMGGTLITVHADNSRTVQNISKAY